MRIEGGPSHIHLRRSSSLRCQRQASRRAHVLSTLSSPLNSPPWCTQTISPRRWHSMLPNLSSQACASSRWNGSIATARTRTRHGYVHATRRRHYYEARLSFALARFACTRACVDGWSAHGGRDSASIVSLGGYVTCDVSPSLSPEPSGQQTPPLFFFALALRALSALWVTGDGRRRGARSVA